MKISKHTYIKNSTSINIDTVLKGIVGKEFLLVNNYIYHIPSGRCVEFVYKNTTPTKWTHDIYTHGDTGYIISSTKNLSSSANVLSIDIQFFSLSELRTHILKSTSPYSRRDKYITIYADVLDDYSTVKYHQYNVYFCGIDGDIITFLLADRIDTYQVEYFVIKYNLLTKLKLSRVRIYMGRSISQHSISTVSNSKYSFMSFTRTNNPYEYKNYRTVDRWTTFYEYTDSFFDNHYILSSDYSDNGVVFAVLLNTPTDHVALANDFDTAFLDNFACYYTNDFINYTRIAIDLQIIVDALDFFHIYYDNASSPIINGITNLINIYRGKNYFFIQLANSYYIRKDSTGIWEKVNVQSHVDWDAFLQKHFVEELTETHADLFSNYVDHIVI